MKKLFVIVLALVLCGMSTAYAKVLVDPSITQGVTTVEGTTDVEVNLKETGKTLTWTSFDLAKGQTVTFYGEKESVNTITSNKASSFLGTIVASDKNKSDNNGKITFINAKGFNIGKTFQFYGEEINFGIDTENAKNVVLNVKTPKAARFFAIDGGSIKISNAGAVTGGMNVVDTFTGDIIINAGDQKVSVGNLFGNKVEITGKNIFTKAIDVNDKVQFTATKAIHVNGDLEGKDVNVDGKNITVKNVDYAKKATFCSDYTLRTGNITFTGNEKDNTLTVSGTNAYIGNATVGKMTVDVERNASFKDLTATGAVVVDAKSFTAKSVDLSYVAPAPKGKDPKPAEVAGDFNVESFNAGKLTTAIGTTVNVDIATKFAAAKSEVLGTVNVTLVGDKLPTVSIAKGSYFELLNVTNYGKIEEGTAQKRVTARNFAQDGTWDVEFQPADN